MLKNTELREAVMHWIKALKPGTKLTYRDAYKFLEANFAAECSARGDATKEPRYQHDARFAVWDARRKGLVKHTVIRGERMKI